MGARCRARGAGEGAAVKRYDLPEGYCCKPDIEAPDGEWVRFEDVEPLITERDAARAHAALAKALTRLLEGTVCVCSGGPVDPQCEVCDGHDALAKVGGK